MHIYVIEVQDLRTWLTQGLMGRFISTVLKYSVQYMYANKQKS